MDLFVEAEAEGVREDCVDDGFLGLRIDGL